MEGSTGILMKLLVSLTFYLLVSSANNLCKQFGPRSGPTICRAWSGSKLFDTLTVFKKVDFENVNISRQQKSMKNYPVVNSFFQGHTTGQWERSGSVVECLTRNWRAAGSSLTGITVLCPWATHINPSLILVQPRKTHPYITERLLMGRKESN